MRIVFVFCCERRKSIYLSVFIYNYPCLERTDEQSEISIQLRTRFKLLVTESSATERLDPTDVAALFMVKNTRSVMANSFPRTLEACLQSKSYVKLDGNFWLASLLYLY